MKDGETLRKLMTERDVPKRHVSERPGYGRHPADRETPRHVEIGQRAPERAAFTQRGPRPEPLQISEKRRNIRPLPPASRALRQSGLGKTLRGTIPAQRLYRAVDTHARRRPQPIPIGPGTVS